MILTDKDSPEALETFPVDSDLFLRRVIRELTGTLEEVVGLEEAAGYISVVGQRVGDLMNQGYRENHNTDQLDRDTVTQVLVDLKQRIDGDFVVIEATEDRLVLGTKTCPFGAFVNDRPSLCMMTSNVFGTIVADNLGYARVDLEETIARGDHGCRIVVHLTNATSSETPHSREYFAP